MDDLRLARELAMFAEAIPTMGPLQAVVFDFDGVHTDDYVWVDPKRGGECAGLSRSDGYGIGLLKDAGLKVSDFVEGKKPCCGQTWRKAGCGGPPGHRR